MRIEKAGRAVGRSGEAGRARRIAQIKKHPHYSYLYNRP